MHRWPALPYRYGLPLALAFPGGAALSALAPAAWEGPARLAGSFLLLAVLSQIWGRWLNRRPRRFPVLRGGQRTTVRP